jgi:hypothetical protein
VAKQAASARHPTVVLKSGRVMRCWSGRRRAAEPGSAGPPEACRPTPAAEDADRAIRHIPRLAVYNELPALAVGDSRPTTKARRQADALFRTRIMKAAGFKAYKLADKQARFRHLYQAALRAVHLGGCVMHPLKPGRDGCTKAHIQVLEAAVETGLLHQHRSPPGSPMMSRYLPLSPLREHASTDPWDFDAGPRETRYVFLRRREDKEEIPFDPEDPTAQDVQRRLELVNAVNSGFAITYVQHDRWQIDRSRRERTRRLRPIHYALFTDDFDHHGRLYTGQYGHQSLRKSERETIRFGREPSVELDFRGLHCRMLYHLEGLDYRPDPYCLWGRQTTAPQRLMAKTLINAAINARSRDAAIAACNYAMSTYTKEKDAKGRRVRKSGKELEDAIDLQRAVREAGLKFSAIYPLAMERHRRIERCFGCDMGITLMRHDSAVALDVLHHFATRCIPCLGVHDSFIVPKRYEADLHRAMLRYYKRRLGFLPVIAD